MDAYASAVLAAVNADMQDIIEALDSLVRAISNALIQYSTAHSVRTLRPLSTSRHEHAQPRAKNIKDQLITGRNDFIKPERLS
jgi:hypothetical protein